jgi:hypothetical protein
MPIAGRACAWATFDRAPSVGLARPVGPRFPCDQGLPGPEPCLRGSERGTVGAKCPAALAAAAQSGCSRRLRAADQESSTAPAELQSCDCPSTRSAGNGPLHGKHCDHPAPAVASDSTARSVFTPIWLLCGLCGRFHLWRTQSGLLRNGRLRLFAERNCVEGSLVGFLMRVPLCVP